VSAASPVSSTEFWYSVVPLTAIGLPSVPEVAECAVHVPGGPYFTTSADCLVVAQVTCTDVWVRSVRYGARVSSALTPGRLACAPAGRASSPAAAAAPAASTRPPGQIEKIFILSHWGVSSVHSGGSTGIRGSRVSCAVLTIESFPPDAAIVAASGQTERVVGVWPWSVMSRDPGRAPGPGETSADRQRAFRRRTMPMPPATAISASVKTEARRAAGQPGVAAAAPPATRPPVSLGAAGPDGAGTDVPRSWRSTPRA